MNRKFKHRTNKLPGLLKELKRRPLIPINELSGTRDIPKKAIYVLYERKRPLYVGRTDNLKRRIHFHVNAEHNTGANFAFKLAIEQAIKKGIIKKGEPLTRGQIMSKRRFPPIFRVAKKRIQGMSLRTIQIDEPFMQYLFEAYIHLELETKYNDFENH